MIGYVHSVDSFGTVDGPGVRMVVFLQGCPMRCAYCHNPDTWKPRSGQTMTAEDILARYRTNKAFYAKGGLTVTGGEPLMQLEFVIELFTLAKREGIHTCLDTAGILFDKTETADYDRLIAVTDLVMLDIKHIDAEMHRRLTKRDNQPVLDFARYLDEHKVPMWIRHVVVPDHTDKEEDLLALGRFIGSLSSVKALDILPYHTMGVEKYKKLGLPYPLENVPALSKEAAVQAKNTVLRGVREVRA